MPRFPRLLRWILLFAIAAGLIGGLILGILVYTVNKQLPDVRGLRDVALQEPMYVYARDGQLLALFGETRRYPIKIEQVPARVKQAFLAAEDAHFYRHHGIDIKGVLRAIWLLAKTAGQERVPGGSTITQQVAKQFFLSSEYSFRRKFEEMLLAMKMERQLSKDEIFELYLNKSFFGNRAYGIAAAAEFYYGKKLDALTLEEAAALAGTPKFPSSGNPLDNPSRARIRRDNYILPRMAELGFVSRAEADAARKVPMHAAPHELPIEVNAPYVAEMVRREMIERFGEDVLNKGYRVTTTVDAKLQLAAEQAIIDGLRVYDHRHGWRKPTHTVSIPEGADNAAIGHLLRRIPAQANLLPAAVISNTGGVLQVVLADGQALILDEKAIAWTHKSAAKLAERGDVIRVRQLPAKPKQAHAPTQWEIEQIPRAQAALVSLDASNGALRALVGGFSHTSSKFNRATQARRQPGSSFKPFLYAAALARGFNPASIVLDAPVVFKDRVGHEWRPQNDNGNFAGPMRLREALVQSRNLVSIRLLDAIGIDYARNYISQFGFDKDDLPPNLSMSLGTASLTPLSVARGYSVFANGGYLVTPWLIDSVRNRDGKEIFKATPQVACKDCTASATHPAHASASSEVAGFNFGPTASKANAAVTTPDTPPASAAVTTAPAAAATDASVQTAPRVIDPRVAWQLGSMMRDVVRRGTATAARVLNRQDVAGKTGSTNEHRDAWFSGFGGSYVTTVWVGRDNFDSLGYREYGGRAALPIWIDYMRSALQGQPDELPAPPLGLTKITVSADGRLLPDGAAGIEEWIKREDLSQMLQYTESMPSDEAKATEEVFDIF